ncbi:MAG TPA: type II toxin-antitoxin system ParD family antitoxin [Terriglobia bacterium]|nr:type II toxin-antitoxin system ParD family antitoxin [Terriglobia bacterium]
MPTRNINLTDHFDRFIETRVTSGRYGNASEIVREGLRLLEHREGEEQAKLQWLRKAAEEGFDQIGRGEGIEFRSMEELDEEIDRLGKEASVELASTRKRA